jgi:radical SAM superfamily enzyme YgiQ (UPF0313 family)
MGYAYLAGYLREKGEPIEVLFRPTEKEDQGKFIAEIIRRKPVLVATGGLFPELELIKEWISLFPKDREFPIVIGGQMVSPTPELAMKNTLADYGVIGEGEIILYNLVSALRKGEDVSGIGGLTIRNDNGIFTTAGEGEIITDLHFAPKPAFDLFPEENWLPIGKWYASRFSNIHWRYPDRVVPVHGGRGCFFNCNFCYHHQLPRYRPVPDMMTEAKELLEKYKGNFLYFGDDLAITTSNRARQLISEMKKNGIAVPFSLSIRFDVLKRLDDTLLRDLKNSGCRIMGLGIESGSDRILNIIGKNCTAADMTFELKRLKEVGILPSVSIMVGQDSETKEDVEMSIQLMLESVRDNPNISFAFSITTPFPGSPLYYEIFRRGLLKTEQDYYDRYFFGDVQKGEWRQVVNMSAMSDREVIQMHKKITRLYRIEKIRRLGLVVDLFDLIYLLSGKIGMNDKWMNYIDKVRAHMRGME